MMIRAAVSILAMLLVSCGSDLNYAPNLQPVADQMVSVGDTVDFSVTASDPDGDTVTLSAIGHPTAATFDAGRFVWPTATGDGGTRFITITATDNGEPQLAASMLVRIDVIDPAAQNHAPIWYSLPADGTAVSLSEFRASFEAVDPDGDAVSFRATLPEGARLEEEAGPPSLAAIVWTPTAEDIGEHYPTIFAFDHGNPSMGVGVVYKITVEAP